MSRWWAVRFRCGSAVLALLALRASVGLCAPPDQQSAEETSASQDDVWLERSRQILEEADQQSPPPWLRSHATQDALALAEEIAKSSAPQAPRLPSVPSAAQGRVLIFGSFSIPRATLRILLSEASQPNVVFVLRGIPKGSSIPGTIAQLRRLLADVDEVPNVIIDPTLFRRFDVNGVPTLAFERAGGANPVTAVGAVSVDWLRRMAANVGVGAEHLGRRGEAYAIDEPDLIVEMQQRLASIDWRARREAATAGFWRQPREFVELPDATDDREFLVDASVRVTQDLADADGHILARAGETMNPLDWMPLSKTLIVFRGTEPRHVQKAAEAARRIRAEGRGVILLTTAVNTGDGWAHLGELERELAGTVYLLPPALAERFHLAHIPATVASRGKRLLVTELSVGVQP